VKALSLAVLVGGFFGDEGKGKIAAYLSLKDDMSIGVRTGAINAGHTVVFNGSKYKLRIIPSAFVNRRSRLLIAAGALFSLDVLKKELETTQAYGRVGVDYNSGIITKEHQKRERMDEHLMKKVGSTGTGVGAAMVERVLRTLKLARDYDELKELLTDVAAEVNDALDRGENVLIEATQGCYLSLYHGTYPFVTSRDVTASAACSEVGVGPKRVDEVIVVFKSYVTRVGGGPLEGELPEEEAARRGWLEVATVTGRKRRSAPFNYELAKRAVMLNGATQVALTKLDVLFPECRGARRYDELSGAAKKFIEDIEAAVGAPVTLIGTGEDVMDIVDRRGEL